MTLSLITKQELVGHFETGVKYTKTRSNLAFFFSILQSMLCPLMAYHHWVLGPSQTLQSPRLGFIWVRDRRYWSLNDKFWIGDIPILLFPTYIDHMMNRWVFKCRKQFYGTTFKDVVLTSQCVMQCSFTHLHAIGIYYLYICFRNGY